MICSVFIYIYTINEVVYMNVSKQVISSKKIC